MGNNIFDAVGSGIGKAKNFWDECNAASDAAAKARLAELRAVATVNIRQANLKNYENFANALGRYLERNYEENGLKKPYGLEDVTFKNIEDQITVNIGENSYFYNGYPSDFSVDYHFEVSREPFNGTLNDIKDKRPPRVSAQEIEMNLDIDLGKYSEPRGFTFSHVIVDDALRRRVKITVKNVHWTDTELMRRMGWII